MIGDMIQLHIAVILREGSVATAVAETSGFALHGEKALGPRLRGDDGYVLFACLLRQSHKLPSKKVFS